MTKLARWGCGLTVAGGLLIGILFLISPDFRVLLMLIWVMAATIVAGAVAETSTPPNFHQTQAEVVSVRLANSGETLTTGTITLRYDDHQGVTRTKVARPFTNRKKVGELRPGDTLRIGVCTRDPTVIRIPFIRLSDESKCDLLAEKVQAGAGDGE
jgi:hypothetical protein